MARGADPAASRARGCHPQRTDGALRLLAAGLNSRTRARRQRSDGGRMLFGVLIYQGVEPIDLATFGVLSMARRIRPDIEICIIAPRGGVIMLANGLRVIADHALEAAPPQDVIVITGGPGWEGESRR